MLGAPKKPRQGRGSVQDKVGVPELVAHRVLHHMRSSVSIRPSQQDHYWQRRGDHFSSIVVVQVQVSESPASSSSAK